MVDISSQNNKINVTVSSSGNTANTNVTPDSAMYYSNKSKEWAISNRIVDNTDYSSKYYANESKKQADISTAKATEVIESGNTAVSNINSVRDNAIIDINTAGATQISNVNKAGSTQVANVNSAGTTQVNLAKEQVTLATNQANIAKEQATIATNKTSEVVASGNEALSNIDTAKNGAITDITNLKNTSVSNITTAKNNAITTITTQETTSKNNVITIGNEQVERVNLTGVDNKTPIFSKSEFGTNESIYQNIYGLKHSTFDKSKFTVVGNPTITDDGIASGFSSSNYIQKVLSSQLTQSDNYKIKIGFIPNNSSTFQYICSFDGQYKTVPYLYINSGNKLEMAYRDSNNTEHYIYSTVINNELNVLEIENINAITYIKMNGIITHTLSDFANAINGLYTRFANDNFNGSIDLKQFSITVDGKEVFNGNKEGLDVIKPDNYTVVGSPTISADGVASGFVATTNYLKTSTLNITPKQSLEINCNFKLASSQSSKIVFALTNNLRLAVSTSSLSILGNTYTSTNLPLENIVDKTVNLYIKITPTNQYLKAVVNGNTYEQSFNNAFEFYTIDLGYIGGQYGNGNYSFDGSIDLNSFRIYVDGQLVYQPCLKIPYTQSKTGSKIVDVAYRDRVIDLYEQEGQAGYYTIDEPNKNFTLPMGEIYGMIGQRSLISSIVTETNRVDIYSDKTCLICGNVATAGTINLPIELVNNNYFITLSTSTKTATSFTTTATGDYILIGKVI